MIGYHYTTRDRWEKIKYRGLYPAEISEHELSTFREGLPRVPGRAIWVWRERLTPEQAWICTTLLADRHRSFDIVLLEIEYHDTDAMSRLCRPEPADVVGLRCNFCVGWRETGMLPLELLVYHIPAGQISLIAEINLLEPFGELCLL